MLLPLPGHCHARRFYSISTFLSCSPAIGTLLPYTRFRPRMGPVKHEGIIPTQKSTPYNDLLGNLALGSSRVITENSALIAPESGNWPFTGLMLLNCLVETVLIVDRAFNAKAHCRPLRRMHPRQLSMGPFRVGITT